MRFGHRRTLAAIEADLATVPVEIVGDEATDDAAQMERILTQHAENAHRAALWEVDEDAGDPDDDEHRVAEATYVCLDPVKYGHLEPA